MNEMIAICGLECHQCGAFLATWDNDDKKRAEVAELWSREYGTELRAEDIHCEGCISTDGVLFNHCHVCEIRNCGWKKGVINCAYCEDYACRILVEFFSMVPEAKERLDSIRDEM